MILNLSFMPRSLRIAVGGVLLTWLVGCGAPTAGPTTVEAATGLLQSSLEAWKEGRSLAEMRSAQPPVYVADDLWHGGQVLSSYQIEGEGEVRRDLTRRRQAFAPECKDRQQDR